MTPPVQRITGEVKEEPSKTHVCLKVQGGDDVDFYYSMKRDFPLHALKLDYCNRLGLEYQAVRFTFNGARVRGIQTANELQMKDGSVLQTWIDKVGG